MSKDFLLLQAWTEVIYYVKTPELSFCEFFQPQFQSNFCEFFKFISCQCVLFQNMSSSYEVPYHKLLNWTARICWNFFPIIPWLNSPPGICDRKASNYQLLCENLGNSDVTFFWVVVVFLNQVSIKFKWNL